MSQITCTELPNFDDWMALVNPAFKKTQLQLQLQRGEKEVGHSLNLMVSDLPISPIYSEESTEPSTTSSEMAIEKDPQVWLTTTGALDNE